MNWLVGYFNPAMVWLAVVFGPVAEHGWPNHPAGWIFWGCVAVLFGSFVIFVWRFTWNRPILKTGDWLDRH